jgi:hypothetical protein
VLRVVRRNAEPRVELVWRYRVLRHFLRSYHNLDQALDQARLFRMRLRAPELCYPSKLPRYTSISRVLRSLAIDEIRLKLNETGQAVTAILPIDVDKRYVTILYTASAYARLSRYADHKPQDGLRRFPSYHACVDAPLKT